jgi:hypothetical protein
VSAFIVAYTYVYAKTKGASTDHRAAAQGQTVHEQSQPGRAAAQGLSVQHRGSFHPERGQSYLAEAPAASTDFMEGIEDLPVQERKP